MNLRSPTVLTIIGVGATLVVTTAVVVVLLRFGGGGKAVSDNAALIGGLIALGGVFTAQLVNISLEDRRAERARETEQNQRKRELELAQQRSQDEALQAYLDQMGELLLNGDRPLHRSTAGDALQSLARSRTLTVLSRLDGGRKGVVAEFLYGSGLIRKERVIVDLWGADLTGAYLNNTFLIEANLTGASLRNADLSETNLTGANLSGTNLREADLRGADLREADLNRANLSEATLSKVYLNCADLSGADLSNADLSDANLIGADLSRAVLDNANLRGADGITNEELEQQASSLKGATMPSGQKYEDWLKSKNRESDGQNNGTS